MSPDGARPGLAAGSVVPFAGVPSFACSGILEVMWQGQMEELVGVGCIAAEPA